MAIKKVKLPNNTVVDINDARIPGVDSTPTSGSTNVVTSGGVQAALTNGSVTKVGTATVGASNRPIYLNAGTPTVTNPGGAFLSWGGQNFSGAYGPIDAAMVDELGACRTMFFPASKTTIEYSTDSGSTWTDYGASNVQKVALFSSGTSLVIGKNTTAGGGGATKMLRITMSPYGSLYTTLNKFVIYISTSGSSGCYCTIRAKTQTNVENNVDTWVTFADQVPITGWSGYNVINTSSLTTYGNASNKSSQYGLVQFIFGCTGSGSGSYNGLVVQKIMGFGGVGWTTPSQMAKIGHLYYYDSDQNAGFPNIIYPLSSGNALGTSAYRWRLYGTTSDFSSSVTASSFIKSGGTSSQFLKADGSVDSNTYATTSQLPAAPGTLNTTATTAQSTSSSEALSGSITLHKVAKTGTYSDLVGKPTIPSAPGTLNTTATSAQSTSSSEALSGSVTLHKVSKTGSYNDLNNKPTIPSAPGTLTTTSTTSLSTATSEALTGGINLHKVSKTGSYNDLNNKPTIPSAPGTLNTNNSTAQTASSSEALSGTINLHKVSKTGTYSDLIGKPDMPLAVYFHPGKQILYFFKSTSDRDSFIANQSQTSLVIFSTSTEPYIDFVDSNANSVCASTWGDGTGITKTQAKSASNSSLNTAFYGNTNITSFDEFQYFTGITQINGANTSTVANQRGFANCTNLRSITFPRSLIALGHYCFSNCTNLERIKIQSIITNQYVGVFYGCNKLTRVDVPYLDIWLNSASSCFEGSKDGHIFVDGAEIINAIIPGSITNIRSNAFYYCKRITSVTFPSTCTSVASNAFYGCEGLYDIVWGGVTEIGQYAFRECFGLPETLVLPSTLTIVGNGSFYDCYSVKTYDVGSGCTSIASSAFQNTNPRTTVRTFIIRATTPPTLGHQNAFWPLARLNKIYVPYGKLSAYQSATNWSGLSSYLAELNSNGTIPG